MREGIKNTRTLIKTHSWFTTIWQPPIQLRALTNSSIPSHWHLWGTQLRYTPWAGSRRCWCRPLTQTPWTWWDRPAGQSQQCTCRWRWSTSGREKSNKMPHHRSCEGHKIWLQSTSSSPRTWPCWRASRSLPPESPLRPERRSRNWLANAAAWSEELKSEVITKKFPKIANKDPKPNTVYRITRDAGE